MNDYCVIKVFCHNVAFMKRFVYLFIYFQQYWGFELRASHLQCRHSKPPALFALVSLEIKSCFFSPKQAWT
jgi:hypothetical protein